MKYKYLSEINKVSKYLSAAVFQYEVDIVLIFKETVEFNNIGMT